jgi:hypothetical protein
MAYVKNLHCRPIKFEEVLVCDMKKLGFMFCLIIALFAFTSCGKEKLTPLVSPSTVNQLRNDEPINFSYTIDPTQIEEYAKGTSKFPIFGKLFQAIAFVLANSSISSKGGMELDLAAIEIDLNSFGNIDFDYIDWIRLNSLTAQISKVKRKDSLEFIEKLEIYALLEHDIPGVNPDVNGMTRLVYYDKKIHDLECEKTCLNLRIEKINWKELIKNNPKIKLQPKIYINSVPKSSMALAGSVSFSIKLKLKF